jgi:hypothetical protein
VKVKAKQAAAASADESVFIKGRIIYTYEWEARLPCPEETSRGLF